MKNRRKYELPCVFRIGSTFNIQKLREEAKKIENEFLNVYQANPGLCDNHEELAASVKDNFSQISLTKFNPIHLESNEQRLLNKDNQNSYRARVRREGIPAQMNEHFWDQPTQFYKGSYFEKVVQSFSSPAIRVRLIRIEAGTEVPYHIDYDPTYAVRIILPIETNDQCFNLFKYRGKELKFHLASDGHPYFLNVGFPHSVVNNGKTDRVALMFSLKDQSDLAIIPETENWDDFNHEMKMAIA